MSARATVADLGVNTHRNAATSMRWSQVRVKSAADALSAAKELQKRSFFVRDEDIWRRYWPAAGDGGLTVSGTVSDRFRGLLHEDCAPCAPKEAVPPRSHTREGHLRSALIMLPTMPCTTCTPSEGCNKNMLVCVTGAACTHPIVVRRFVFAVWLEIPNAVESLTSFFSSTQRERCNPCARCRPWAPWAAA